MKFARSMCGPQSRGLHQARRPQIRERHLVVFEQGRSVGQRDRRQGERLLAELVDQIADAAPRQHVDDRIRHVVLHRSVHAGIETRHRMRECAGRRPRHGEDHVQRDMQPLRTVDVAVARRVGDDPIGLKRRVGMLGIRFRACAPRRREDIGDHRAFLRHVLDQLVDARGNDAAAGLDPVVDQLMRIAAQRIELELCLLDHRTELVMRRDARWRCAAGVWGGRVGRRRAIRRP